MPRRCPADPTTPPISFPNASVSTLPLGLLGEQVSKCTKPGHLLHSSLALLSGPHGPTSHLADARSDFCRPRSSFLGPRSGGWAPGSRSPAPPITTGTTSVRLLGGRCHRRRQRRARRDSSRACREGRHCWILRRQRRLRQIWGLTAGLDPAVVIPDPVEGDDHRGGEGIGDYGRHGVRTWPRDATRRRGRRASAFSIVVSGYVRCCGSEDVSIDSCV